MRKAWSNPNQQSFIAHTTPHTQAHTRTHTMAHSHSHTRRNPRLASEKRAEKRRRRRAIPHIFGNDRLDELLLQLLDDCDPRLRLYVYRLRDNEKIKPALIVGTPFCDLLDYLRDIHGGGQFCIMIRRGKKIELSGSIAIWSPSMRRQKL